MPSSIDDAETDRLVRELSAIALRCANLRVLDDRPQDEVPGHDEHGLPS